MNPNHMEILWLVWGVVLAAWLIMLAYQAKVTSREDDQLFLTDTRELQQQEQLAIVSKVHSIQPVLRGLAVMTAVLSVALVGLYAWDAARHLM
jgi:hypothetical protein